MSCVKSRISDSTRPGETMHNSSPLQALDRPAASPHSSAGPLSAGRRKAGELGRIAAASCRRGEASHRILSAVASPAAKGDKGAFGPFAWALAVVAAWGLLVGGRAQIVRLIPATAPLYAAIGLDVNLRQMDIAGVLSKLTEEDGREILVVEGEIRNLADTPRAAPRMRLAVLDANGNEIYAWTAAPPKSRLLSGEKASFRARLAAPPPEGREVRVRFAANPDKAGFGKAGFGS